MDTGSYKEEVGQIFSKLNVLSERIDNELSLDLLLSYGEEFYEKFSLAIKKINEKDVQLLILQKDSSGSIKFDNGQPVLKDFIIQDS